MDPNSGERLLKNYYHARKTWEAWCFVNNIHLEPSKPEVRSTVDNNEFLTYARFILLKDLHIELHKILKDKRTSADNIFFHLRKLDGVESNKLLDRLDSLKTVINNITDARDKFYAHLDPDFEKYIIGIPIVSFYKLFKIIEESIIALGLKERLMSVLETIPSRDEFNLNQ